MQWIYKELLVVKFNLAAKIAYYFKIQPMYAMFTKSLWKTCDAHKQNYGNMNGFCLEMPTNKDTMFDSQIQPCNVDCI